MWDQNQWKMETDSGNFEKDQGCCAGPSLLSMAGENISDSINTCCVFNESIRSKLAGTLPNSQLNFETYLRDSLENWHLHFNEIFLAAFDIIENLQVQKAAGLNSS